MWFRQLFYHNHQLNYIAVFTSIVININILTQIQTQTLFHTHSKLSIPNSGYSTGGGGKPLLKNWYTSMLHNSSIKAIWVYE